MTGSFFLKTGTPIYYEFLFKIVIFGNRENSRASDLNQKADALSIAKNYL
jgi:hypothetical protein